MSVLFSTPGKIDAPIVYFEKTDGELEVDLSELNDALSSAD
jgi:hypothetical protein